MIRCLVWECGGRIVVLRGQKNELTFKCSSCGAGPGGTAKSDEAAARRRLLEVKKELDRLKRLLGDDVGADEPLPCCRSVAVRCR